MHAYTTFSQGCPLSLRFSVSQFCFPYVHHSSAIIEWIADVVVSHCFAGIKPWSKLTKSQGFSADLPSWWPTSFQSADSKHWAGDSSSEQGEVLTIAIIADSAIWQLPHSPRLPHTYSPLFTSVRSCVLSWRCNTKPHTLVHLMCFAWGFTLPTWHHLWMRELRWEQRSVYRSSFLAMWLLEISRRRGSRFLCICGLGNRIKKLGMLADALMSQRPSRFSQLATSGHREVFDSTVLRWLTCSCTSQRKAMLASVRVLWPSLGIVHPCLTALNVSDPLSANLKSAGQGFSHFFTLDSWTISSLWIFLNVLLCLGLLGLCSQAGCHSVNPLSSTVNVL